MDKVLTFLKCNSKNIIFALIIAIFVFAECIISDSFDYGKTEKIVTRYDELSDLYVRGYDISGSTLYRKDLNAFVIASFQEAVDLIDVSINSDTVEKIKLHVFCTDGDNAYKEAAFVDTSLKNGDNVISIKVPNGTIAIKIIFIGNYNDYINLKSIDGYRAEYYYNVKFFEKALLFVLLFFVPIFIFFSYITYRVREKSLAHILVFTFLFCSSLFIVLNYLTNSYYWGSYFFENTLDSFMDHFNMLALLNNSNPYYQNASYPAMCFAILSLFRAFLPKELKQTDGSLLLRNNMIAMFEFVLFIIICILIILWIFKKYFDDEFKYASVFVFSGPILYSIQRGNIILLAFIFLMIYFSYYDSNEKRLRYISYIALAISASIKIYPALFGFMTLKEKRYKETIHLGIMGIVAFLVPFWLFDGVNTLKYFFHGLLVASVKMASQGVGQNFSLDNLMILISYVSGRVIPTSQMVLALTTVFLIINALLVREQWKSLFLLATGCLWFPTFSFSYMLLMFFPAIFSLIKAKEHISKVESVMLGILISPLALPYLSWIDDLIDSEDIQFRMSYSGLLINMVIVYFVLTIVFETLCNKFDLLRNINKNSIKKVVAFGIVAVTIVIMGLYTNRNYDNNYAFKGKGTKHNPYEISCEKDLQYLISLTNSGEDFEGAYFVQTSDINLSGDVSMEPIGTPEKNKVFSGFYNGQGYSINNYYSLSHNDGKLGLFGNLNGEVSNLNVLNANIAGGSVGGIAYEIKDNGRVSNCYFNGVLFGYDAGGIALYNAGVIENTVAFVNINATKNYGITRKIDHAKIINSYSNYGKNMMEIDEYTIERLCSYAERRNQNMFNKDVLNMWTSDEVYFVKIAEK